MHVSKQGKSGSNNIHDFLILTFSTGVLLLEANPGTWLMKAVERTSRHNPKHQLDARFQAGLPGTRPLGILDERRKA